MRLEWLETCCSIECGGCSVAFCFPLLPCLKLLKWYLLWLWGDAAELCLACRALDVQVQQGVLIMLELSFDNDLLS